jgi:choline dehydrogenase-like flavoprotein
VYRDMGESLKRLAPLLRDPNDPTEFVNPFLTDVSGRLNVSSITLSHPLGGCRIAADASQGVVDEYGRVFDASSPGGKGFYEGLYVADAAIIPTALGVNPSLTISALALRISDQLAADLPRLLEKKLTGTTAMT